VAAPAPGADRFQGQTGRIPRLERFGKVRPGSDIQAEIIEGYSYQMTIAVASVSLLLSPM
jgi:hypothetical protein